MDIQNASFRLSCEVTPLSRLPSLLSFQAPNRSIKDSFSPEGKVSDGKVPARTGTL